MSVSVSVPLRFLCHVPGRGRGQKDFWGVKSLRVQSDRVSLPGYRVSGSASPGTE